MGTPFSKDPNICQCEPSLALRSRLMQDLNVKGLVTCPDKIDMRAIIPCYTFTPPERLYTEQGYSVIAAGIGGAPQYFAPIMAASLIPLPFAEVNYLNLKSLLVQIAIDTPGRAAMAAAGDGIVIWLTTVAGTIFMGEWDIVAMPGSGGEYWFGSHLRNWNAANTYRPRMDMEFLYPYPIKITSQLYGAADNYLWLTAATRLGGAFPANAGISHYSIFDYFLK